jgi:hypothetical protein
MYWRSTRRHCTLALLWRNSVYKHNPYSKAHMRVHSTCVVNIRSLTVGTEENCEGSQDSRYVGQYSNPRPPEPFGRYFAGNREIIYVSGSNTFEHRHVLSISSEWVIPTHGLTTCRKEPLICRSTNGAFLCVRADRGTAKRAIWTLLGTRVLAVRESRWHAFKWVQSVPQRKHDASQLQRSTGQCSFKEINRYF